MSFPHQWTSTSLRFCLHPRVPVSSGFAVGGAALRTWSALPSASWTDNHSPVARRSAYNGTVIYGRNIHLVHAQATAVERDIGRLEHRSPLGRVGVRRALLLAPFVYHLQRLGQLLVAISLDGQKFLQSTHLMRNIIVFDPSDASSSF